MVSFNALKNKPLEQPESYAGGWAMVISLYLFAVGTASASFIPFEESNQRAARMLFRILGLGAVAGAIAKTREIQSLSKWSAYRDVVREDQFIAAIAKPALPAGKTKNSNDAGDDDDEIAIYDLARLRSEATGVMISGNPGHGKSSVALWLLGWLTQMEAAIIEVCDPHAGVNRGWAENGFSPVSDYGDIELKFKDALKEFSARKKRAENGENIGCKYILVADETDGYSGNFKNPELITKVQTVLGKEGRKYGVILIFITHTSNVTNKGIDAQERDCFCSINLGVSAMAKAEKTWGKKSEECKLLRQQAYPCVIVSNGIPHLAIHPTHSEYTEFKQSGNPPKNLLPINRFQDFSQPQPATASHSPATIQPQSYIDYLERAWDEFDIPSHSPATQPQQPQSATNSGYSCPECGSHSTKWHDRKNGRRKCNECKATWTTKDYE